MAKEYEVGKGRPPKHTRWKTGQSGNPNGRPRGSRNLSTDVKHVLNQRLRVTKDGRQKTMSAQLAVLMRLGERALSGDLRALERLIELARLYNDEERSESTVSLGPSDAEILKGFEERVLRRAEKPQENEEAPNGRAEDGDPANDDDDMPEEDDDNAWLR